MTISSTKLSDTKRALLAQRLQKARAPKKKPQIIGRRPEEAPAVLSFAQRRLWFLSQWEPDNPAYTIRRALRFEGTLDVSALQKALNGIVGRHPILHTIYDVRDEADGGEPIQLLHPDPTLTLAMADLRQLADSEQESEVERLFDEAVHAPFDITAELPIRALLICLDDKTHLLLLTIHHIATDEWSWQPFMQALMAFYQGEADSLPELPLHYSDFAYWQRHWLQGEVLEKQLTYWKQQLAGAPAVTELPTDRPYPPVRTHRGAHHTFQLTPTLSRAVQALSEQTGITPFMILLSALQLVLHRYTGQEDVLVGSPIAGRNRSEIEGLIGFFVNTLVFRTNFAADPTVEGLWQRVRDMTLAAYEHQDLPFEKLVDELQLERSLSHTPLFQVLFNYHNTPQTALTLPDLRVERMRVISHTAKFDLSLNMSMGDEGLRGTLTYNCDLFDEATITRMAAHFETVLGSMIANPKQRLSGLPLLTVAEQAQLAEWAVQEVAYDQPKTVHALFEAEAAAWPDKTAVVFEDGSYSYRELNERANQLAHHLRALGIRPDDRVGLFIERSLDILVGMLGVLKAGGAYVPIDPIYPPERIQFMLEDVGARILLTQAPLRDELPDLGGVELICLDSEWSAIAQNPSHNPDVVLDPANLMYLLFTSGSTGQPKGVAVEHRNFLNYIKGLLHSLALPSGLSYAIVSTLSADLGATNLFGALCSGGQIHIISYERAADPPALADYFSHHHIDVMKLVPSHFEVLQAYADSDVFLPHHCLILAGEACPWETIAEVRQLRPGYMVQNHYGPTETVVSALHYPIPEQGLPTQTTAVPLGRPFGNVAAHILDELMRPVPVGIAGELYLGGPGVSRGYLNRPVRTAQSFVPNPFATKMGERLYRTGDRVRYLPDGNIAFLGRIDQQVKIRGFRVELGEIEALLTGHDLVQDAVVSLREDTPGDKRLVAYVVGLPDGDEAAQSAAQLAALRDHLREHLPAYMVPTGFMHLDKIPLNANGKVDRKALPQPEYGRLGAEVAFTAPQTQRQADIAAIWADVLEIEQIGIDDNFFDLGGESFKAIRVVRQIGDDVSVMELFKYPTVRELADYLDGGPVQQAGFLYELTRPISIRKKKGSMVCVPYGGGNAVVFQPLAQALSGEHSLYAVQLPGHDYARRDEALRPIEEVAQQCAAEIMRDIDGPVSLYGHCVGGGMAVEIARQLEAADVEVQAVFLGGTFPAPRLPGKLFEWFARGRRRRSNRATFDFLRMLGGFSEGLEPEEQTFMLKGLRHDVEEVEDYYTEAYAVPELTKLKAPIVSVVGEMDRVAEFYEERYEEWRYFSKAVALKTIPLAGHYFLKHQASELAHIVEETLASDLVAGEETAVSPAPAKSVTARIGANLKIFFMVILGQLVSMIGTNLTTFALSIWALEQTGQLSEFALINVFGRLPAIVMAPLAGAIADRYDRRWVMIASDLLAICSTLGVAALFWTGNLEVWHLYITACISSIANTFQEPAYTAAVTQLIPKQYLGHANGLVQFGSASGRMFALFLGGVLVVTIGLEGILLIDFVSFLFAICTLLFIRFPDTLFRRQEEPLLREIVRGWDYIVKRQGLVAMIVFFALVNFFLSIVTVLSMPLVLAFESPAVLGVVAAMLGAGMLVGGAAMSFWGGTERRMKGMIGFVGLSGVASMIMGWQPSAIYAAIGFFGLGATGALIDAHWRTLIQTKVGLELQGRVLSTNRMMALSTMPLGALLAGPLVDNVLEPFMTSEGAWATMIGNIIGSGPGRGIALLMVAVGFLRVVLAVIGYSYRPLRMMEDDLPDAIPDAVIVDDKDLLQAQADALLQSTK